MKDIELIGSPGAIGGPQPRLVTYGGRSYYMVQPGDTLWGIASDLWGDGSRALELWWAQPGIFRAVRGNMNNIHAGEVLLVPEVGAMRMMGVGLVAGIGAATDSSGTIPQPLADAATALQQYLGTHPAPSGYVQEVFTFQQQVDAWGGFGQLPNDSGGRSGEDGFYGANTADMFGKVLAQMGAGNAPPYNPAVEPGGGRGVVVTGSTGMGLWAWLGIVGLGGLAVGGTVFAMRRHMKRRR